jgi:hypothetical protein
MRTLSVFIRLETVSVIGYPSNPLINRVGWHSDQRNLRLSIWTEFVIRWRAAGDASNSLDHFTESQCVS